MDAVTNQIISKKEMDGILGNRVTLDYNAYPIRITDKEINDAVSLQSRLTFNPGTHIKKLIFDNCKFNEDVDIGNYENAGNVVFQDCLFNKSVQIDFGNSVFEGKCVFENLTLRLFRQNSVMLTDYNVDGTFTLIGSPSDLTLENIKAKQVLMKAAADSLRISKIVAANFEFADHKTFESELTINDIEVGRFTIGKLHLNTQMSLNNCKVDTLQVDDLSGNNRIIIIADCKIREIKLRLNTLFRTFITNAQIDHLELSETNQTENILNIEKTTLMSLRFEKLYNNGLITLRELNIPTTGTVAIKSSNLGKIDFIHCDFSKAILEFENSKITEAFFSETEFPKKVLIDGKKNYNQAQLTFGQLATAFQKQGDNIRALEYNSRELEAHYKSIRWMSQDFFRKLNLWLNAISNNFGRDWVRGGLFSFGVGLLFFCLLLISTDKYRFGWPILDFNMLPAYLKFMNPLRFFELESLFNNTSKQGNIQLNGLSYLSDFGGRIFIAYGYYQTIQAFRKFGRK